MTVKNAPLYKTVWNSENVIYKNFNLPDGKYYENQKVL